MTETGLRLGVWAFLGEPRNAAELERSGLDWVVLDGQHGHFDDRAVRETMALRRERLVPVLVRVRANDAALIGRALDAGADGVIVPLVDTAGQAEAAVVAASYPPRGSRSWGPIPGLERIGREGDRPPEPMVVVMVETALGLSAVAEIAATPGVDMVLLGPSDLALSLGTTVDELIAADGADAPLPTLVRACRDAGAIPAAFAGTEDRAAGLARLGFDWVVAALDTDLLASGGRVRERVHRLLG